MSDKDANPAMIAARRSWRCVQAGDKQGWLALMAEDICMEDPIGVAATNPDGKGIRGKAAVSGFYDEAMAPMSIEIVTHESFAAGLESAHRMTLTTSLPNGAKMVVDGIFTYRVNDEHLLTNLRGFWTMEDAEIVQPS